MRIEGRKGEVTLPDGRVVSKQRAYQINHRDTYNEYQAKWKKSEAGKSHMATTMKRWHEKFKREHGMTYYKYRKMHNEDSSQG